MPLANSDRNLLFGILALQLDFIDRDALIRGMQAWVLDKQKPLGQILQELSVLSTDHCSLLETLVEQHLRLHEQSASQSLAKLGTARSLAEELRGLGDSEIDASLHSLSTAHEDHDPFATRDYAQVQFPPLGGRFRILRPHARGGLGEVHVAIDEELHREVAFKEIQPHLADNAVYRARFLQEAEITGGLEHPGIVPVYSLGAYEDGRPYYAMRFIQGESLKEAIERFHSTRDHKKNGHSLELRKLLRRFLDVCNAMTYAHSRGILHRDLKPSNIMLGAYGETLVVDWGLAKAMGPAEKPMEGTPLPLKPGSAGDTSLTEMGAAIGTPAFMSPEQASGRLDLLGPASDVYSLGATLYMLLTGVPAFREKDAQEIQRKTQIGLFPAPRKLDKTIDPALEAICLKAMATKPSERYLSARDLADDIEHWLADEPVAARPDPWTVTLRRWITRHRTPVAGLAAALVVAATSLGAATYVLSRTNRRLDDANQNLDKVNADLVIARDDAVAQKERAAESYRLARTALDSALAIKDDERLRSGRLEDLRKQLAQAGTKFYEKYAALRADEPGFRYEQAMAYSKLGVETSIFGNRDEAVGYFEKAAAFLEQLREEFPQTQKYTDDLEAHYNDLGFYLARLKRYAPAEQYLLKARAIQKDRAAKNQLEGDFRALAGLTLANLAMVYQETNRLTDAEAAVEESIATYEGLPPSAPMTGPTARWWSGKANAHTWRGFIYGLTGRLDGIAEREKGIALWKELAARNPQNPQYERNLAVGYFFLAMNYQFRKDWKKEEENLKLALIRREHLTQVHPTVPEYKVELADVRYQLAWVYQKTNRHDLAQNQYPSIVKTYEDLQAEYPNDPQYKSKLAWAYNDFALMHDKYKEERQWEELNSKSLKIRRSLAKQYPQVEEYQSDLAASLDNLGSHYAWTKRDADKAIPYFEEGLLILNKLHTANLQNIDYAGILAINCLNAAYAYDLADRQDKALELKTKALGLYNGLLVKDSTNLNYQDHIADCRRQLGITFEEMGRTKDADEAFQAAIAAKEALKTSLVKETGWLTQVGGLYLNYGDFLEQIDRPEEALQWVDKSIDSLRETRKRFPKDEDVPSLLASGLASRGLVLSKKLGKHEDALKIFDLALKECGKEDEGRIRIWRACAQARQGDYRNAVAAATEAMKAETPEKDEMALARLHFDFACVYALADQAASKDSTLAEAEKNKLRDQYASQAVAMLEKAKSNKYFSRSSNRKSFLANGDFHSIKNRQEFQQLVKGL